MLPNIVRLLSTLLMVVTPSLSFSADEPPVETLDEKASRDAIKKAAAEEDEKKKVETAREFASINFGVGIAMTFDDGKVQRVGRASLDENNIVRADDVDQVLVRVMLETHLFIVPGDQEVFGFGPLLAILPGKDDLIDAIGVGIMLGLRTSETAESSFNVGFGYSWDPNTRVLGSGIEVNKPLPEGETQIRFREKLQRGWMVLFSFSWL